jgi:nitrous-oxide reductase
LTGVLQRHEDGEKWVTSFIQNPEKHFAEPYVKSMIDYFNLRMPNQNMSPEETKNIVEYLKWVEANANLF